MTEKYTGTKTLEQYLNEQKEKGQLDEVTNNGNGTITVELDGYEITIKEDNLSIIETATKTEEIKIEMPTIEESAMFSKAIGVIDIVWLDINNNVITNPISPKNYLGGLTAIKYSESEAKWVEADENNLNNTWYNYVAQTGTTDGKTSKWANARTSDSNAYFVWIPRYAYKITYFDTEAHANAYRESGSTEGIIGYSNIEGMVDVQSGIEKLVKDSKPINVTGKVRTRGYTDYIPHPAFQFGEGTAGTKAGIWVGKFESSSSTPSATDGGGNVTNLDVRIVPNVKSWKNISVGNIFTVCSNVKTKYGLTSDSHMMKNTEWGSVAYLAESKYGRNGKEIGLNSSFTTGQGDYVTYANQSTTGNIYGMYDMNGGSNLYVAGILDSVKKNGSNDSKDNYYNFTEINSKYYNAYASYNKNIKGDGVFEIWSRGYTWHGSLSMVYVSETAPVWLRGRD